MGWVFGRHRRAYLLPDMRQRALDLGSGNADCPAPMAVSAQTISNGSGTAEFAYAWLRLATSVLIGTIGSVGLWSYVVALPAVQADFGVTRADASLAYTLNMIGFGIGAVTIGGLVDRFGIVGPAHRLHADTDRRVPGLGTGPDPHGLRAGELPDRHRQLRGVRAPDRRHLALVHAPAGHRRRRLLLGQLHRRRGMAADRPAPASRPTAGGRARS